jgi:tetratricopeptide (TPR) repeat protein
MTVALAEATRPADAAAAEIERLWTLERLNLGPVGYFASLANGDNEILAVGAANVLLDQGAVPDSLRGRMVELATYQSIQLRAFDYFMSDYDYERARAVLETPLRPTDALVKRQLAASLGVDPAELAAIEIERFFRTGEVSPIAAAASAAEGAGGWRKALPLIVDLILVNPQNAAWPVWLGRALRDANRFDLLARFCEIVDRIEIFPNVSQIFRALLAGRDGAPRDGLKLIDRVAANHVPTDGQVLMAGIKAELFEKLGRYEDAYGAYMKQNRLLGDADADPGLFARGVGAKAALDIEGLSPEGRNNHFIMCGFARSGTTLLEYALGSHPRIEAFEEIPSFASIHHLFLPTLAEGKPLASDFAAKARERYYREIDRRKKKAGADIFVDKQPMLSAEARFLRKLFPEKRYVFIVRHPFDVVLSCFKQAFARNVAMDNFLTFADACRAYDFTMGQWFGTFGFDSPEVCYVRYDRLVLDFKAEVSRVLAFLGADWHEDILHFAERAEEREVRTPSYAKVRSGVSIGVQTAWRNYAFLYKRQEARPLDRWVKVFGYEGL